MWLDPKCLPRKRFLAVLIANSFAEVPENFNLTNYAGSIDSGFGRNKTYTKLSNGWAQILLIIMCLSRSIPATDCRLEAIRSEASETL